MYARIAGQICWDKLGTLFQWEVEGIPLCSHLWYLWTYIEVIIWFPLLRYIARENESAAKARKYILAMSAVAILVRDIQKVVSFGTLSAERAVFGE